MGAVDAIIENLTENRAGIIQALNTVLFVLPGAVQQRRHPRDGKGLQLRQLAGHQHIQRKFVTGQLAQDVCVILPRVEGGQSLGVAKATQRHGRVLGR